MKKRAKLYLIVLTAGSLVLFCMLSLYWINRQALSTARQTLQGYLNSTAIIADTPEDAQEFVQQLAKGVAGGIRITLMDKDGNVLGDSQANPASMPNHKAREEISQALTSGYGEAVRASDTTGVNTLYAARTWQEAYVLRFAMPMAAAREFVDSILPVLLFSLLILCILITMVMDRFSKKLAQPYEQMLVYIESMLQDNRPDIHFTSEYEEMQPIVQYFHYLLEQISGHIEQITSKTTEIENIVGAMQEGLVLLDESWNILMINPQACSFMSIPKNSWQKRITYLYRNEEFAQALSAAAADKTRQMVDIHSDDKVYRFFITPVPEGGFVLFLSDVTELTRLEQVRSEFVANVTHELKTPLTSISGFAELIETGMVTEEEKTRNYAGKIHSEALRLVRLIDDILKLSSVENAAQAEPESRQAVNMRGIVEQVLEMLDTQLTVKEISVSVEGKLTLLARHEDMYELVQNLCDNAVKYNKQAGRIEVNLLDNGFSVKDTGIGIPPEHQERIFERFYRADKARSRKTGGTGLGLSISKHVAALYGGVISVESDANGSTFTVAFPPEAVVK